MKRSSSEAASNILPGLAGAFIGPFRATGRLKLSAACTVLGYWFIALPLGYFLAFSNSCNLGMRGLWYGFVGGFLVTSAAELYCSFLWIDYEKEAVYAFDRNEVVAKQLLEVHAGQAGVDP